MAKQWTDDAALVSAISRNLYDALPLLPKRLVRVDALTRELGMPFSHIQILCMLSDREMTIGEISSRCGFSSQSYFCRVFKDESGMTPLQYQKSLMNNKQG